MKNRAINICGMTVYPGAKSVERLLDLRSAGVRYNGPTRLAKAVVAARIMRRFGGVYIDFDSGNEVDLSMLTDQHRGVVDAVYWDDKKGVAIVIGDCLLHSPITHVCERQGVDKMTIDMF